MAIISRFNAVAMVGKLRLTGLVAWLMWLAVHLVYITGFEGDGVVHWAISFLGRGRSERTTTEQQIFARSALARLERGATDLVSEPGEYDAAREARLRAALQAQRLRSPAHRCRAPWRPPDRRCRRSAAAGSLEALLLFRHRLARPFRQETTPRPPR